jgi:hypothetical protein
MRRVHVLAHFFNAQSMMQQYASLMLFALVVRCNATPISPPNVYQPPLLRCPLLSESYTLVSNALLGFEIDESSNATEGLRFAQSTIGTSHVTCGVLLQFV